MRYCKYIYQLALLMSQKPMGSGIFSCKVSFYVIPAAERLYNQVCICAGFYEFISLSRDLRDSKFLLLVLHHCSPLCQGVKGSQGLFQPAESLGQGQLADLWTCSNTHTSIHTEKPTRAHSV